MVRYHSPGPLSELQLTVVGNYGGTAGIAETLLQSHAGTVHLLPAISSTYATGSVKGLVARGGFEVSIDWKAGKFVKATVLSKIGGPLKITVAGGDRFLVQGGKDVTTGTTPGTVYTILPS